MSTMIQPHPRMVVGTALRYRCVRRQLASSPRAALPAETFPPVFRASLIER